MKSITLEKGQQHKTFKYHKKQYTMNLKMQSGILIAALSLTFSHQTEWGTEAEAAVRVWHGRAPKMLLQVCAPPRRLLFAVTQHIDPQRRLNRLRLLPCNPQRSPNHHHHHGPTHPSAAPSWVQGSIHMRERQGEGGKGK
jgi:hypothetical protein